MGAFHEGHLSLMRTARQENEYVVVSLFVNPTQFRKGEDYERYPRHLERDADLAGGTGVDVIFAPSADEMYPHDPTVIHVPQVGDLWEGERRPGQCDGVSTVVCRLLSGVGARRAWVGVREDLQQCAVIERMVSDLNMPVELRLCETVRDGLAMSSRNAYLDPAELTVAPAIRSELRRCQTALANSQASAPEVEALLEESRQSLRNTGFSVDYFELVSTETMQATRKGDGPRALIAAAALGTTRLIDNVRL